MAARRVRLRARRPAVGRGQHEHGGVAARGVPAQPRADRAGRRPAGADHAQPRGLLQAPSALPARAARSARRLLALAVRRDDRVQARRTRTRRDHADLAEAAKELLVERIAEPPSLAAIAATLYVSPFHLARAFRSRTGFSLAGYVHGLRLRRAVDRLAAEPDVDLSRLAVELGYCSPSHFSDRFRAAFGCPPSRLRGTQLSTIVEVPRLRAA